MTNRADIKRCVDAAALEFERCLALLSDMKRGRLRDREGLSLIEFQPTLATALSRLSGMYLQLSAEKERRIRAKRDLSGPWFVRRMRFLSRQQEVVSRAIHVGRCIGDGFAWFFYQNNRRLLLEHLKEPTHLLIPQGVGGFAELEMAKKVPVTDGHFVVYHGITSILRLGDFSLVDLKDFTVKTIGEIKAGKPADGALRISMIFPDASTHGLSSRGSGSRAAKPPATVSTVPAQARLDRQLRRIVKAYKELNTEIQTKVSYEMEDRISSLEDFLKEAPQRKCRFKQFGKSLLLIAIRHGRPSLYERLGTSDQTWKKRLSGVDKEVMPIVLPTRKDNALFVNGWPYQEDGRPSHRPGMIHPLWWPLSSQTLRQLMLQEIVVFTVFNPAHLFEAFEQAGFETETDNLSKLSVKKELETKLLHLEGVSHYLQLIQEYFFSEADVVRMLSGMEARAHAAGPQPTRIELYIEQSFGKGRTARGASRRRVR